MRTLTRFWTLRFGVALVVGLLVGIGGRVLAPNGDHAPPRVYAIDCQPVNDNCTPIGNTTKTSSMTVDHETGGQAPAPVEPDDGESWKITAKWVDAAPCQGASTSETATVDVAWNGSTWMLSNQSLTNNIVGLSICTESTCTNGSTVHSTEYKLIVDVEDPHVPTDYNLKEVRYETTSVDDGDEIGSDGGETDCNEVSSVSPTSQSFSGIDDPGDNWTSSRCGFSCSVGGGSMTITYN